VSSATGTPPGRWAPWPRTCASRPSSWPHMCASAGVEFSPAARRRPPCSERAPRCWSSPAIPPEG
jgi:hypothetical protein